MLALAFAPDLGQVFSGWPTSAGWTGVGLVATVLGLGVGVAALVYAVRIFRLTKAIDDERHEELTFALDELKRAYQVPPSPATEPDADLSDLDQEAQDKLRAELGPSERIIRLAKTGAGKGNRPWLAVTTRGRVLRAYRGGRTGGWHVGVLY